jgi:hypothetical protein
MNTQVVLITGGLTGTGVCKGGWSGCRLGSAHCSNGQAALKEHFGIPE